MKKFVMTVALAGLFAIAGQANAAFMWTPGQALIKVGSTGSQVMALQACMNELGHNTGIIDGIYGPNTKAGVMSFQAMKGYQVDGIIGDETGPGYQDACAMEAEAEVEEEVEADFGETAGEEADIEDTDTSDSDEDEIVSDKKDQHLFSFEIELDEDGGALRVDRVDFEFDLAGGTFPEEDDMYDIFEAFTIMVDGDEVISEDADDDDDWRETTDPEDTFRMNGVDVIIESGETVEFDVYGDIADLDEDDDLDLDVDVTVEIRYTDEAGITDEYVVGTENIAIEAKDAFDIDLDESNDNPDDDMTLSLAEDEDMVVLYVGDVTIDGQDGTLEDVDVTLELVNVLVGDSDDYLTNLYFFVDGDEIDSNDDSVATTVGTDTLTVNFDLDDMEVELDDEFEIEIKADFEEIEDGDHSGASVQVTDIDFNGEDSEDDDFTAANDVTSDAMVLTISGGALLLEDSSIDGYNEIGSDDNAAKVVFEVEVKADGDEDITLDAVTGTPASVTTIADAYDAFVFEVDGVEYLGTALDALAGYTLTIEDSAGDDLAVDGELEINDGSTETYEITVVVDAVTVGVTGEYEIELVEINWVEDLSGTPTEGTLDLSLTSDEIDLLNS